MHEGLEGDRNDGMRREGTRREGDRNEGTRRKGTREGWWWVHEGWRRRDFVFAS